jgi:hypothetical protein
LLIAAAIKTVSCREGHVRTTVDPCPQADLIGNTRQIERLALEACTLCYAIVPSGRNRPSGPDSNLESPNIGPGGPIPMLSRTEPSRNPTRKPHFWPGSALHKTGRDRPAPDRPRKYHQGYRPDSKQTEFKSCGSLFGPIVTIILLWTDETRVPNALGLRPHVGPVAPGADLGKGPGGTPRYRSLTDVP